jgi:hypothetical protein
MDMTNAELIAGLAGPMLIAVAVAILVNRSVLTGAVKELAASPGLIFFAGILTLLAGLAIVRAHNVWAFDWTLIVTLFGWLCVVGGIARIVWPDRIAAIGNSVLAHDTRFTVWVLVALALGAFLTLKGYALI